MGIRGLARADLTVRQIQGQVLWPGARARRSGAITGEIEGLRRGAFVVDRSRFAADMIDRQTVALTVTATGSGALRGLDLTARTAWTSTSARIRWTRLRVRTPHSTWRFRPSTLGYQQGRLQLEDLHAWSASGTVRGHADIDVERPLGPRSRAAIRIDQFDLAAVTGLLPDGPFVPAGEVSGAFRLDGSRPLIDLRADLRRLRWHPSWPEITADIFARIDEREVRASAFAKGRTGGLIRVAGRGRALERWPSDWRSITLDALRQLNVGFDIDLEAWPPLADAIEGVEGRATGRVHIGPGARVASFEMNARALRAANLPNISMLQLSAEGRADALRATARATIGEHRASSITARIEHGLPELLRRSDWTSLRGQFNASVDGFPLKLLRFRFDPADAAPVSGRITVRARGRNDRRGPLVVALAEGHDVRLRPDAPPIQLGAQGYLTERVASATATLSAPELGDHRVAVRARLPSDRHASVLDRVDSVSWDSKGLKVAALRAFGVDVGSLRGRIDFRADSRRGLSVATATVAARALQLSPAVAPVDVTAFANADAGRIRIDALTRLGGAVLARAKAKLSLGLTDAIRMPATVGSTPLQVELRSDRFPLARALVDAADRRGRRRSALRSVEPGRNPRPTRGSRPDDRR